MEKFYKIINKTKISCEGSKISTYDHFVDVNKMVEIGLNTTREIKDIMLTRYACYLIVQNGDSKKKFIALGQTYFATQTRKQELAESHNELDENRKRVSIRKELKIHNISLAKTANKAGVKEGKDFAIFQNRGYKGLYGGLGAKEIHNKKGLKKSHKILDYMGSTELAANLFRATQTEEKLKRENIRDKNKANITHYEVGAKVRKTIEELGGTMPEELETPKESIGKIEKDIKAIDYKENDKL